MAGAVLLVGGVFIALRLRADLLRRTDAVQTLLRAGFHLEFEPEPHFLERIFHDARILRPLQSATCKRKLKLRQGVLMKPGEVVGPIEGAALAEFPECRQLFIHFGTVSLSFLTKLKPLRQLVDLELCVVDVDDEGCREIAKLSSLKYLGLTSENEVRDGGVVALAALPNLTDLDLCATNVGDAALAAPLPPNLQNLDLGGTDVTAAGLAKLAAHPTLRRIGIAGLPIEVGGPEEKLLRAAGKEPVRTGDCTNPSYVVRTPNL